MLMIVSTTIMITVEVKYVGMYDFVPSEGAAIAFAILFFITMAMHAFRLLRIKTWLFILFLIGLISKSHLLTRALDTETIF